MAQIATNPLIPLIVWHLPYLPTAESIVYIRIEIIDLNDFPQNCESGEISRKSRKSFTMNKMYSTYKPDNGGEKCHRWNCLKTKRVNWQ